MLRSALSRAKPLVVKVGTGTLTDADGRFDRENCARLGAELAELARGRRRRARLLRRVALGAERLGLVRATGRSRGTSRRSRPAPRSGQPHLMAAWGDALGAHGRHGRAGAPHRRRPRLAQALPERAPHLREAARRRRRAGRERERHGRGGRDQGRRQRHARRRSSRAASRRSSSRCSPTSRGSTTGDPASRARRSSTTCRAITAEVERIAGGAGSERSVGGMATKVKAARRLGAQGVATALLSGRRPGALAALLAGERGRDGVRARRRSGSPRARAGSPPPRRARGVILVDAGARRALVEQGRSLLPSGVRGGGGRSSASGDPVDIAVDAGAAVRARARRATRADEVRRIAGLKTSGDRAGARV